MERTASRLIDNSPCRSTKKKSSRRLCAAPSCGFLAPFVWQMASCSLQDIFSRHRPFATWDSASPILFKKFWPVYLNEIEASPVFTFGRVTPRLANSDMPIFYRSLTCYQHLSNCLLRLTQPVTYSLHPSVARADGPDQPCIQKVSLPDGKARCRFPHYGPSPSLSISRVFVSNIHYGTYDVQSDGIRGSPETFA